MKRLFLILIATMLLASSCSKDGDYDFIIVSALGVVTEAGEGGYFEIKPDSQDDIILRIKENARPDYPVEKGQRVNFKYTILEEYRGSGSADGGLMVYDIKLVDFLPILSKPIVTESYILEDEQTRRDEIGYDGVEIYRTWFYGDWINMEFKYARYNTEVMHVMNLVWDDTRPADGRIRLAFCHNAMGEIPGTDPNAVYSTGVASFRLSDILPEGESARVEVVYRWYDFSTWELKDYELDCGIFSRGDSGGAVNSPEEYCLWPPVNTTTFVR